MSVFLKKLTGVVSRVTSRSGKALLSISILLSGLMASAMAAAPVVPALTLSGLKSNISGTEYGFVGIMEVILTLAGVLLIIKGIVHFKQQYTSGGGGQEKHLSKGIACCVFGACLFIVVPIAHAIVTSLAGGATAPTWSIQDGTPGSIAAPAAGGN